MNYRNAELVKRYEAGASAIDLAREYGISRARVYQILEEEGVRSRLTPAVLETRRERAVRAVVEGRGRVTIHEAAKGYGVSRETLAKALVNLGFDYPAARKALREAEHAQRAAGEGEVVCSRCKETKLWSEMSRARTSSGAPTRRTRCKSCQAEYSADYYRRKREK